MKALLTAAALAGVLALPAAAATPKECHPPDVHVHGFDVTYLIETGIGCHYARAGATHFLQNKLHGYQCSSRVTHRRVYAHCVQIADREYAFSFNYYVH